MNGTPQQQKWPEIAPYKAAIEAFDTALTRAGYDEAFRKRLTESPASAKAAIAEIGNFTIPDDRVIVFYEPQGPIGAEPQEARLSRRATAVAAAGSVSSENVHVFYLPPLNKDDQTRAYRYEEFLMCCYDQWIRT